MGQMNEATFSEPNINGYLKKRSERNELAATLLAKREGIELTSKHWDIINYLRTEFYSNGGVVPLVRHIRLSMEKEWQASVSPMELSLLFPGGPNVQGAKIAGCVTMRTVSDLLRVKGDAVWSVGPGHGVMDVLSLMTCPKISSWSGKLLNNS